MDEATRSSFATIAGQIAAIVGVIHLGLGMYYTVGGPGAVAGDPRVIVWTAAGVALVGGVAVATIGWMDRRLYVVGAAVVGLLIAGHFIWPVLRGGNLYLGPVAQGSQADPLDYVAGQLLAVRPIAKVLLALEVVLLVLLVALFSDEGPR